MPRVTAGPRYYGGPRFVENVIVQRPPIISTFIGLPALGFFVRRWRWWIRRWRGDRSADHPVAGRPRSLHRGSTRSPTRSVGSRASTPSSRRDGALTLGRIGDPRAIPAFNERLEHDFDKEVRVAAAWALGEIGDERGAVALEKAIIHDHRNEVRDAARLALKKIPKPGQAPDANVQPPSVPAATHPRDSAANPSNARPFPTRGPTPSPSQNVPLEPPDPTTIPPRPPPVPVPPRPIPGPTRPDQIQP